MKAKELAAEISKYGEENVTSFDSDMSPEDLGDELERLVTGEKQDISVEEAVKELQDM
jgi:hypothetical protein